MLFILLSSLIALAANFSLSKYPTGKVKFLFLSPVVLVVEFFVLYMVVGFNAYWKGDFYFLGTDFSSHISAIYAASAVFLLFFSFSFLFFCRVKGVGSPPPVLEDFSPKYHQFLILSFVLMLYAFLTVVGFTIPVFHNLIMIFFNSVLVVASYCVIVKVKYSRLILSLFVLLVLYMGFRYRLIFIFLPILFYYFANTRLGLLSSTKYLFMFVSAVSVVAVVGVSRRYSEGLQFERLEGLRLVDILVTGIFNDTSTVISSGALIDWLSSSDNFAYFNQIVYVVNYFIPNAIYPEKLYSPIFTYVSLLTGQAANESGVAVLGVAEYYHTAGYFGVFIFAVSFALLLAHFYKRAIWGKTVYAQFAYFVLVTWFINSMTRGYLPQNFQDLFSILIGLYLIRKISIKYLHPV
ncbi:hypothetical protein [Cycloclasticus pugetii]|uniref:hypothetical protein n=1 Tax=Cycloclasticus pugetii TaxID=34068 RepID=UPI003A8CF68C